eukprot:TRINITY_DN16540_c0_g1_i1.p1 TRINITY_DN16540_c0_g1~~TRINITY_DN16540_c0_g1_i1.p1  ORF type:complete len:496 (+),score=73.93 TRINITY_DN16540_c0_g1_i1:83-1570(+)
MMTSKLAVKVLMMLLICIWLNYSYWLHLGAKEQHTTKHGKRKKGVLVTRTPEVPKKPTPKPKKTNAPTRQKKDKQEGDFITLRIVGSGHSDTFSRASVIPDSEFSRAVRKQALKMKEYMTKESKKKPPSNKQLTRLQREQTRGTGHILCYSDSEEKGSTVNATISEICKHWESNQCLASPAARSSPLLHDCEDVKTASYSDCIDLELTKSLHIGGKTALYKGTYKGDPVGVKHYPPELYESFTGFHLFVSHTAWRHPWINYPTGACMYDDNILQRQPFLIGYDLTKWKEKKKKKLEMGEIISWAMRIACIHQFMHTHPDGPFTYDDNHPGQYFITDDGPVMVDIDTMQKTLPNKTTTCRCFGCNGGRANCQFINSPEGFKHCLGSSTEPTCGVQTDIWFLGQILNGILPKGTLTPMTKFGKDVSAAVLRGEIPKVESPDDDYTNLVRNCFSMDPADRPTASEIVSKLADICEKYDSCKTAKCPPPLLDTTGYRDA